MCCENILLVLCKEVADVYFDTQICAVWSKRRRVEAGTICINHSDLKAWRQIIIKKRINSRYSLARRTLSTHCKGEMPTKITTCQNFKKITGLWVRYIAVTVNSQDKQRTLHSLKSVFYRRSNGNLLWMRYSLPTLRIVTHYTWCILATWRGFIRCLPAFKTGKWKYL
jgi:hypothetical protein